MEIRVDESLPTLNVALLEQCLKWAEFSAGTEGNPAWYQGSWALAMLDPKADTVFNYSRRNQMAQFEDNYCGTSFCMAGYALQETGNLTSRRIPGHEFPTHEPAEFIRNECGEVLDPSRRHNWYIAGGHVLGLAELESYSFFDGDNTLPRLKTLATLFAARRGVPIHIEGEVEEPDPELVKAFTGE